MQGVKTDPVQLERFITAFAQLGIVGSACKVAGVSRPTIYWYREHDTEFAAAWELAKEEASDRIDQEIYRRGMTGVKKPVFGSTQLLDAQGQPVTDANGRRVMVTGKIADVTEYSDTLLIFLAKGVNPKKYREQVTVRHEDAIDTELVELEQQLRRRGLDPGSFSSALLEAAPSQEPTGETPSS